MSNIEIFKVKDKNEKHHIKKGRMFDVPFRLLVVGKSQSGKSNIAVNLLLQEDNRLYKNVFDGEDIYIFSPSARSDYKLKTLIEEKEIPKNNIFGNFDEDVIEALYELVKDEYEEAIADGRKPTPKLFIFDDMSAGGNLKAKTHGIIAKIFMNGRHIMLSSMITAQKYSDIPTSARENATGAIFFSCSNKQLELIENDFNYLKNKNGFREMFREATNEPYSFFVVNLSNPLNTRYMDRNFQPIDYKEYE
jgi:hypothetical protein